MFKCNIHIFLTYQQNNFVVQSRIRKSQNIQNIPTDNERQLRSGMKRNTKLTNETTQVSKRRRKSNGVQFVLYIFLVQILLFLIYLCLFSVGICFFACACCKSTKIHDKMSEPITLHLSIFMSE